MRLDLHIIQIILYLLQLTSISVGVSPMTDATCIVLLTVVEESLRWDLECTLHLGKHLFIILMSVMPGDLLYVLFWG